MKEPCRKVSFYLPEDILRELQHESERQQRTMCWLLKVAWMKAKDRIAENRHQLVVTEPPKQGER